MLVYREKQRGYGMMNESEVKRQLELLDLMNQAELREKFCDLFGGRPILQTCAAVLPTGFKRFITADSPKRTGNFLSRLQTAIPRQISGMEKMEFPMCAELATRGSGKVKNMK